jgi:3-deoxy-D-manno-octulosonic-acid transferase
VEGRKGWEMKLKKGLPSGKKTVWVHCSSLGEFEQGRPLIEMIKRDFPAYKIVLTFFSPSGYEIRKDYSLADYICYLPMDGKRAAAKWVSILKPSLVVFVKYEFWYHYLRTLHASNVPVIIISAAFRKDQAFFRWYGGLFRKMLGYFRYVFVQDEPSRQLLASIGLADNCAVPGDTRYDRVAAIAAQSTNVATIEHFRNGCHLLIAGSTWPNDELALKSCMSLFTSHWKLIVAPHEIDASHLNDLSQLFGNESIFYSSGSSQETFSSKKVLIIDNIGMLASLYRYGAIAYVGGGFEKGGIHNILEPAIFGMPVVFGPNYQKFVEANQLVEQRCAFPVRHESELLPLLQQLMTDNDMREQIRQTLAVFTQQNMGSTKKIVNVLEERGWLN